MKRHHRKRKFKKHHKVKPKGFKQPSEQLDRGIKRRISLPAKYAEALEIVTKAQAELNQKEW